MSHQQIILANHP
jgi:hypothetical protein